MRTSLRTASFVVAMTLLFAAPARAGDDGDDDIGDPGEASAGALIETVPDPAPALPRVATLLLRSADSSISLELADSLTELIIGLLSATGRYGVVGKEEVKSLLGVTDEMKALDCITSAPCLGALATHLSVVKALVGTVALVDGEYRLSIALVNLLTGKTENNTFIRIRGDETALSEHLAGRVVELVTPRPDPGVIAVTASVEGASVILDGVPVGTAPLSRGGIAPGMHAVQVVKPGFLDWKTETLVNAGGTVTVEAVLEADPAYDRELRPGFRAAAIITGSTAAVAAGAGVVMGVLALGARDESKVAGLTQSEAFGHARNAIRFRDAANGLYIGAGVVGITSAVLMIAFSRDVFGAGSKKKDKKKKKGRASAGSTSLDHIGVSATGAGAGFSIGLRIPGLL